jgi:uncharacterized protein YlaI
MGDDYVSMDINNTSCEGIGCKEKVTRKIIVKVGNSGSVALFLCDKCRSRFSNAEHQMQNSKSEAMEPVRINKKTGES